MELRFTTAGESHGPGLTAVLEGLPAGLEIVPEDMDRDLARRQLGHGRGGRMKIEKDRAQVTAGLRHGRTIGSPVALWVINKDYENWEERMNPWPVDAEVDEVHLPRPGHADLAGLQKFEFSDVRNVLERASARETTARVAVGGLAKAFLRNFGVEIRSHVLRVGSVAAPESDDLDVGAFEGVDDSPVRCLDADASAAMVSEIDTARKANESLGGIFEVRAYGLVPGLGAHVSWSERLDGRLGQAIMSIHAMKGAGIGDAFDVASRVGSEAHDEIFFSEERGYYRETNRAGGLEGGMTNGEPLVVRGAMKPLPTLTQPLRSVDTATHEPAQALRERTDSCTVPAAGRRRGGDGRPRARLGIPREVRRRLDRRRARRAARLRGANRMEEVAPATTPSAPSAGSRALVFVGFMGAGKSTAARTAAAALETEPLDSDRLLEAELGETIEAFFDREGEDAFRAREEEVVLRLLERPDARVVALGGGALGSERVRAALAGHTVVHLDVEPERAWQRASGKGRPLARDRGRFDQLASDRRELYASVADADLPPLAREAVREVVPALAALSDELASGGEGARLVWARAALG